MSNVRKEQPECFGKFVNGNSTCDNCEFHFACLSEERRARYASRRRKSVKSISNSRPDKDTYYLDIALAVSKRSTCNRRHYGCVIVKDDVIVATGYNGSPKGEFNCCDAEYCTRANEPRYSGYDKCPAVHAEQNALLAVDRLHSQGATLYLACEQVDGFGAIVEDLNPEPCSLCTRMIKNAGITRVVNRRGEVTWA